MPGASALHHRLRRMTGRDPGQAHRAATPLELLFDLTFAVAFGQAADQLAHYVAEGHSGPALAAFAFSMLVVVWAWINFSWFASAYDTDDWLFRVLTMVQMIGVLVLTLGIPTLFVSLDEGAPFDNGIMVAGYVVMRVALVLQWIRAAAQDPARRQTNLTYAAMIFAAQVAWVVLFFTRTSAPWVWVPVLVAAITLDILGPIIGERRRGGTPWNPRHIAERYGLLVIIALGESIFGTVASVSAIVQVDGWSQEAVMIVVAGVGLTFGMWWTYYIMPSAEILTLRRSVATAWSYSHLVLYTAIAATGAGLHIAAYVIEDHAEIDELGALYWVAVPVLVYMLAFFVLYSFLVRAIDAFHYSLVAGVLATLAASVILVANGASMGIGLIVVMAAPIVVVVGYEAIGYRHEADVLARLAESRR
ncbi:low temperature requirement protein A [Conyzicola nivalis]|uniref:Membrane protein n=2 Tax=Conyzicola nivalis TaxID=1477021 RepID=A0A916WJT4_9MICO|nr:membrane protein [Conyzicola nivalis]